jgi:hypothetical protein
VSLPSAGPYRKFLTSTVGLALTYAVQFYGTNHWVTAAVAVASALGVYAVPNDAKPAPASPPASGGQPHA